MVKYLRTDRRRQALARDELMQLYIEQLPQIEQLVLAGDHTACQDSYAVTLKERTYEHLAKPLSGAKPVTVGTCATVR